MNRITLISPLLITSVLLSSNLFAHTSLKGEVMPIAATPYNWTGFYIGANAGLINHTMNITDVNATTFNATLQQTTNSKLTGGLQAGYRRQLDLNSVSGVYGLEISANFSNAKFSKEYGSPFAFYQLSSDNELKTTCLLQLIGGIAADRTLLFIAAGLSWVNLSGNTTNVDGIPFFNSFSVAKKELGTALSGGIEYAFSETLSARFRVDVITPNHYSTSDDVQDDFEITNNITQATLGINYKFA